MKLTLQKKNNESTNISRNKSKQLHLIISKVSCQNGINTSHEMKVPIGIQPCGVGFRQHCLSQWRFNIQQFTSFRDIDVIYSHGGFEVQR